MYQITRIRKLLKTGFTVFLVFGALFNVAHASSANICIQLQQNLDQFRSDNNITGMSLYVNAPHHSACYLFSGSVKKGVNQQIAQNNLWQIGSISKSYFAAILLQLEAESEAGQIPVQFNINQTLKEWLPQYPAWSNVTIKQLLNMTSGIYSYTDLPISQMILKKPRKIWAADEIIQLAYQHQPNTYFAPGMGWHYSDTDYILAGELIQKIVQKSTGKIVPLDVILQQQILRPLALQNTYYDSGPLPQSLAVRMVHGYNYYSQKDFTAFNLSIAGPAGGIISNPKDVANWVESLLSGHFLPQKQLDEMRALVSQKTGLAIQASETSVVPAYSLGLMEQYSKKWGEVWLYQGVTSGYSAIYFYLPQSNTIVSFTASIGSIRNNPVPFSDFAKAVLHVVLD